MSQRILVSVLLRLTIAWVALTALVATLGPYLLVALRPGLQWGVEQLLPGMMAWISADASGTGGDVLMELQAIRPLPIAGSYVIAPFVKMQERINAGHDLMPVILLGSVLLAWPYRSTRQAAVSLALGAVVAAVLVTAMTSVHLAGLFEIRLQKIAESVHLPREAPPHLALMLFLESGGQWLVALVGALGIGSWFARLSKSREGKTGETSYFRRPSP